jgi:hypothetical protein
MGAAGTRASPRAHAATAGEEGGVWPPGFFVRFPGAFADDPIERGDQGVAEEREQLG